MGRIDGLGIPDAVELHAQSASEQTGGDLFDIVRVGSRVAFLLSDIAGRRPELDPIAEAMHKAFRASATTLFSAADVNLMEATETIVLAINHALTEASKGVRFAPTMVGCYDAQLGILAYVNAGGQRALIHDSAGTHELPSVSVPLGLFTHLPYDASIEAFAPGAVLLVVTKGVEESLARKGASGPGALVEVLQNSKQSSASELCQAVLDAALHSEKHSWQWMPFRGSRIREDMTALALIRTV